MQQLSAGCLCFPLQDAGHNYRLDHSSGSNASLAAASRKKGGLQGTTLSLLKLCFERAVDSGARRPWAWVGPWPLSGSAAVHPWAHALRLCLCPPPCLDCSTPTPFSCCPAPAVDEDHNGDVLLLRYLLCLLHQDLAARAEVGEVAGMLEGLAGLPRMAACRETHTATQAAAP